MSRRCRRRLARALSAAWSVLFPANRAALFKCCRSRLQEGTGAGGGGGGACALDLLRSLPVWRSSSSSTAGGGSSGGGDELAAASVAFARSAVTNGLRSMPAGVAAAGAGGGCEDAKLPQSEQTLAAAAMFLAARADDPGPDSNVGGGGGGGGGARKGNGGRSEFWAHSGAEEVARQAGEKLGGTASAGLSGHALAAIAR